jgi:hypothetical protein
MSATQTKSPAPVADSPPALPESPAALESLDLRAYVRRVRAIPLVVAGAVTAIFLPILLVPYGFSDDYSLLWMAVSKEPSVQFGKTLFDANATTGRPLMGLLDQWFFSAAGTIENLRFVRLVAVVGILAIALLLHWALVRARIDPIPAALIVVLVCSLPAFQIYAAWTTLFSQSFGALLGGAASFRALRAVDPPRSATLDRVVGAVALLLAGLLIYQPAAMFFWVFFAVALVGSRHDAERAARIVRMHAAVAGIALALWYVVLEASIHLIGNNAPGATRSKLTHDPVGKIGWFLHEPLFRALNLFDLTPTGWFAAVVAIVAAGGMALWLKQHSPRPLFYGAVALCLVPLSYLPNLVVAESWAAIRTQLATSSLIALYACLGTMSIWVSARDALRAHAAERVSSTIEAAVLALAVVFVGASAVIASKNLTLLVAEPQMTELRLLRSQVAALPANTHHVAFVETDWYGGMTNLVVYDEFGLATSVRPWALEPAVDLILREEGRLKRGGPQPIVDVYGPGSTSFPPGEPVLDLRGLRQLR